MSQCNTACVRTRSEISARRLFSSASGDSTGGTLDASRSRGSHNRVAQSRVRHGRSRLYTRIVSETSPELFDDIYLGLRAGGAVRKQRRGEPLSAEEEEAIGRWQRLSLWRKFIAIGAFALGTFGLGFTVGGIVFGRWRAARR